jgi:CUG-BP- and ETR3-like factor
MEESAIKLFVGQVPKLMTEVEQAAMFCDVAIVNEVTVIRDTATKILRGSSGSVCLWDPYACSVLDP